MCIPLNKTKVSSLNPFSCNIQIFKLRIEVSYFLHNFENLQRFFTGEPLAWRPWTWCLQGGFLGVSFHLRRCPQGVASILCKKTPLSVPDIKVRPPDGITVTYLFILSLFSFINGRKWEDAEAELESVIHTSHETAGRYFLNVHYDPVCLKFRSKVWKWNLFFVCAH